MDRTSRRLFVSNMGEDSISAIDIENNKEYKKIHLSPLEGAHSKKRLLVGPHSIKIDTKKENIYSVNCYDNSVSIIDLKSYTVIDSFFAGIHPNDMAFSIDGEYAYITNCDSDSISIIDMSSLRLIAQVPVGMMPHGIAISPDGEYIYTVDMGSGSISIIETWSHCRISSIKVGECPMDILTSKDGRFLYVVCSFSGYGRLGAVAIISTKNYKVIKLIEVGDTPTQVVLSDDNCYLYVTNIGSGDLYTIELDSFSIGHIVKTGNMARGIAKGEDVIYVANSGSNSISVIQNDKSNFNIIKTIEAGIEPTSMVYVG